MKQSTKASLEFWLIKWFRKLFNYTPFIQPYIVEERKIQKIRTVHKVLEEEFIAISKEEIEKLTAQSVLRTMLHIGAIKFTWANYFDGSKEVEAITYVPEKL